MIDARLRAVKDRTLAPVASALVRRVHPHAVTFFAAALCVSAGVAAAGGMRWTSVALWLAGRMLDGLDGALARMTESDSDLGGYLDIVGDTLGYAAVPLGIAFGQDRTSVWETCALLLATFYVNALSWTYLSAIAEKRAAGAASRGERTSVHMPSGLIEGAETIVLFAVMLAWPAQAAALFAAMAGLVVLTIVHRVAWAARNLT